MIGIYQKEEVQKIKNNQEYIAKNQAISKVYGVRDVTDYENDGLSINLDLDTFTSFEPIQGSTVTCEVSFDERKFIIKCDQKVVG